MNIPNIPSDNLYKFVALASLVTLILTSYFMKSLQYEIASDLINLEGDLKQNNSLSKELIDDLNEIVTQRILLIDELEGLSKKVQKNQNRVQELNDLEIEINEKELMSRTKSKEIERLRIEADTKGNLINNKEWILNYIETTFSYSVYILSIFMVIGFYLWYIKVQKHQDKIIKYQADSIYKQEK